MSDCWVVEGVSDWSCWVVEGGMVEGADSR